MRTDGRRGTTVLDPGGAGAGRYQRALDQPVALAQDLSTGVPDEALLPRITDVLSHLERAGTRSSHLEDPVVPELADLLRADWPYEPPTLTVVDVAMDGLDLITRTALGVSVLGLDQLRQHHADRLADQIDAVTGTELSSSSDRADWDKAIGGSPSVRDLVVDTEDPADGRQIHAASPNIKFHYSARLSSDGTSTNERVECMSVVGAAGS